MPVDRPATPLGLAVESDRWKWRCPTLDPVAASLAHQFQIPTRRIDRDLEISHHRLSLPNGPAGDDQADGNRDT